MDFKTLVTLAFLDAFGAEQSLLTYFADLSGPAWRYCTECNTEVPDGVSKPCLLGIYRLDLESHPPVQFAGPEGPSKLHWGVGVKVQPINTEQTRLGPPIWYLSIALSAISYIPPP